MEVEQTHDSEKEDRQGSVSKNKIVCVCVYILIAQTCFWMPEKYTCVYHIYFC